MSESEDDETIPVDGNRPTLDGETAPATDGDQTVLLGSVGSDQARPIKRIGRYKLLSELGQGGQGAVYLAEDERIRRKVALKVLFGGLVHSTEARLRFEREAEATARLNHSGIAKIHEFGETEGAPFIAMELVEGRTLAARLSAARQDPRDGAAFSIHVASESQKTDPGLRSSSGSSSGGLVAENRPLLGAARFVESTARALHVAHEAGLVHRDIKPGNIMVRPDESPCILDFGLAHDESSVGVTLTGSNDRFGTPAYMAPEQVRGRTREIDRRSDVWALGAVLYECCTLQRPFEAPTRDELFERIKNEEPKPPRGLNPKIPKDLEAIILTALDKDAGRRYATAEGMAEDLRRFRELKPVQARPAGRLLKTYRWVQRNKIVTGAGTIVMSTLLVAAVVFFVKGEEATRERERAERESSEKDVALGKERAALARETTALAERTLALEAEIAERKAKEEALADYDRLADVKRIEAAIAASDRLHPPSPALIPKLESWQEDHGVLADRLEGHKRFLAALREQAQPYGEEARNRDFARELAEIKNARAALAAVEKALGEAGDDEVRTKPLLEEKNRSTSILAILEEILQERRSWQFEDQALQFQHDLLLGLVGDLESFVTEKTGPVKTVAKRLAQSRAIARETLEGELAARWTACRERIGANPLYSGLQLEPQLGLIPLGPDPDSQLEEFLHWLTHTGAIPERDEKTGKVVADKDLGVVLVLIPGGKFLMGSQNEDPARPNFDPESSMSEQPVHEVELSAYFLSKYEMTQGQWWRAFATMPGTYWAGWGRNDTRHKAPVDLRHPVEAVSWQDLQLLLPRMDLQLPTEAEWERAARAGRSDQIFSGTSEVSALSDFANIRGIEGAAVGWTEPQPGHEDGYIIHAPVGSFRPNAYGLHDMTGNLTEWCQDGSTDSYADSPGPRGLRAHPGVSGMRSFRGGTHNQLARPARVAKRDWARPVYNSPSLGLRPARVISD